MNKFSLLIVVVVTLLAFTITSIENTEELDTNISLTFKNSDSKVEYVTAEFIYNINSLEELSGFSTNIFIGKVSKYLYTDTNTDETVLPVTYYKIEVLENLKGNVNNEVVLYNFGGYNEDGILTLMANDSLPIVGEYYVFITVQMPSGEYYVEVGTQKVLLENTDDILAENKEIIKEIKKAIINEVDVRSIRNK